MEDEIGTCERCGEVTVLVHTPIDADLGDEGEMVAEYGDVCYDCAEEIENENYKYANL